MYLHCWSAAEGAPVSATPLVGAAPGSRGHPSGGETVGSKAQGGKGVNGFLGNGLGLSQLFAQDISMYSRAARLAVVVLAMAPFMVSQLGIQRAGRAVGLRNFQKNLGNAASSCVRLKALHQVPRLSPAPGFRRCAQRQNLRLRPCKADQQERIFRSVKDRGRIPQKGAKLIGRPRSWRAGKGVSVQRGQGFRRHPK